MSDQTVNPDAAGDAAAGPKPAPAVRMVAHFVRDLSFENVAVQEGRPPKGNPEINVTVNLDASGAGEDRFQVGMKINATARAEGATRFIVELDYVGMFEVANVPREHIHPILFIECPRLLLPYARRVVSDVTRDGGYPPLMLDNVDFATLYRQKLEEMQAQGAQGAPATDGGDGGDGKAV